MLHQEGRAATTTQATQAAATTKAARQATAATPTCASTAATATFPSTQIHYSGCASTRGCAVITAPRRGNLQCSR